MKCNEKQNRTRPIILLSDHWNADGHLCGAKRTPRIVEGSPPASDDDADGHFAEIYKNLLIS